MNDIPQIIINPNTQYIKANEIPALIAEALHPRIKSDEEQEQGADIRRISTEIEHKNAIRVAIRNNLLTVISPTTRLPVDEFHQNSLVKVEDLKTYLEKLNIELIEGQKNEIEPYGLSIIDDSYIFKHADGGLGQTNKNGYEEEKFDFNERLRKGRYTLNDAALALEKEATISAKDMVKKLVLSAQDGDLKMYHPDSDSRYLYGEGFNSVVRDFYEVTTYEELNKWLAANEPLIRWRFPEPQSLNQLGLKAQSDKNNRKHTPKTDRQKRLYAEISTEVDDYKNKSLGDIHKILKAFAGKEGSCIKKYDKSIEWIDYENLPQVTSFSALRKWLYRENKT